MLFECFSHHLFIAFRPTHKVDTKDTRVFLSESFKVFNESIVSEFIVARYFALCCDPHLLPESRHTASDLYLGQTVAIVVYYLFSFNKVSNMSFIINASVSISSPSPFLCPSADHNILQFLAVYVCLYLSYISLDQGT